MYSTADFKSWGAYKLDNTHAFNDWATGNEFCGYKNDPSNSSDRTYITIEMNEVMLDEFNVFDYGINDDFAKNLNFPNPDADTTIIPKMEDHFWVHPYEYDSGHYIKFSEWVL